jgi:acyl-CoA thioester hydrolase
MATPLVLHRAQILPEWVDYNGHMSEAYYVLVFGHATDAFLDHIGMDDATRQRTGTSLYTVEAHIHYLQEAHEGEALSVATRLLGHDVKRVHLHHELRREPDGVPLAAAELMLLHVTAGKTTAMLAGPLARVASLAVEQAGLPPPTHASRVLAIPRRSPVA